jgi:hypothetical protein
MWRLASDPDAGQPLSTAQSQWRKNASPACGGLWPVRVETRFPQGGKTRLGLTSGKRAVGAPIPTAGSLACDAFFTDADALLQRVSPRTAQSPRAEKRVSGLNVNVTCGGQFTDEGASDTA